MVKFSIFYAFESDFCDFGLIFMSEKKRFNFKNFLSFFLSINFNPLLISFKNQKLHILNRFLWVTFQIEKVFYGTPDI